MVVTIVKNILIAVEIICSLILIGIILIQRTRGGMGMAIGGGMGESLFGAQVGNVLTKTTVIFGIIFLVNTTILAFIGTKVGGGILDDLDSTPAPVTQPVAPVQHCH